jgi:hypothetical protein
MRVTNGIPLGWPVLLPVHAVYCVQTLKVPEGGAHLTTAGYLAPRPGAVGAEARTLTHVIHAVAPTWNPADAQGRVAIMHRAVRCSISATTHSNRI